jgi:hypothetical protein
MAAHSKDVLAAMPPTLDGTLAALPVAVSLMPLKRIEVRDRHRKERSWLRRFRAAASACSA